MAEDQDRTRQWFEETHKDARIQSQAYGNRLAELWWLNLVTVVMPAILSTLAAIFAALDEKVAGVLFTSMPLASELAGGAAVLVAVHKALKCEDYQAECLRLSQFYRSIAVSSAAALAASAEKREALKDALTTKLEAMIEGTRAQVPRRCLSRARRQLGVE